MDLACSSKVGFTFSREGGITGYDGYDFSVRGKT